MRIRTEQLPPPAGVPGLTQGAYGAAGNLELAVPAADGSVRIHWYNADPVDARSGAALRSWSRALVLALGAPVTAARISQLRAGPRYLELLAIAGGRLLRKYWTPDRGFVDAGTIRDGVRSCSAFVECGDGRAAVLVTDVDGRVRLLRADLRTYPELHWQDSELPTPRADAVSLVEVPAVGLVAAITAGNRAFVIRAADGDWTRRADVPGSWRDVALVGAPVVRLVGVDAAGTVRHTAETNGHWPTAEPVWPGTAGFAVAAAPSTLDGGRLELVLAGPPGLHHGWAPLLPDGGLGRWSDPELVRARYWVEDDPE